MKKFSFICPGHLWKALSLAALAVVPSSNAIDLPTPPANFHVVFRLQPHIPASKDQVDLLIGLAGLANPQGLGQTVGLSANVTRVFGKEQFVVNPLRPTNFFSLDQSNGALSYSRDLKRYEGDFEPVLPDEDESEQIANEYLLENELMPELAQGETMRKAALQTVAAGRTKVKGRAPAQDSQPVSFDKLKVLTFSREINGLPVVGPGSKIVVTIGDQGDVEGVIRRWRAFTPVTTTKVPVTITPQAALNSMKARLEKKFPELTAPQRELMIKSMDLAYYDSNIGAIQPVYVFRLDLAATPPGPSITNGGLQEDFVTFAPYLKVAPEAIYQLGDLPNSRAPREGQPD